MQGTDAYEHGATVALLGKQLALVDRKDTTPVQAGSNPQRQLLTRALLKSLQRIKPYNMLVSSQSTMLSYTPANLSKAHPWHCPSKLLALLVSACFMCCWLWAHE
jgi:hypothetical protein